MYMVSIGAPENYVVIGVKVSQFRKHPTAPWKKIRNYVYVVVMDLVPVTPVSSMQFTINVRLASHCQAHN